MPRGSLKRFTRLALVAWLAIWALEAQGFVIGYGGRLASSSGAPIAGPVDLTFRLYRTLSDGAPLAETVVPNVELADGMFQVELSLTLAQMDTVFGDGQSPVYIEVSSGDKVYRKVGQYSDHTGGRFSV